MIPSFSIWNKKNFIFTISVVLWNKGRIYIFIFRTLRAIGYLCIFIVSHSRLEEINTLRLSECQETSCSKQTRLFGLFLSNIFESSFPDWWWFISFRLYSSIKGLLFDIFLTFFQSFYDCKYCSVMKTFIIIIFRFSCRFLFFIQSGETMCDSPRFIFILWNL